MSSVLFLCTGNAARSVMAGVALAQRRPELAVETAGTLTVDGLPISWRTRAALDDVGLPWPRHASKQATREQLARADLVVGLAPEHVDWVRREHPELSARTGTLIRLATWLPAPPGELVHRVEQLALHEVELAGWEEVVDPGGGEVETFIHCARDVVRYVERLARLL